MQKLLFEIGLEEIPAKFMPNLLKQLSKLVQDKFTMARIPFKNVTVYGTPRRLAFIVTDIPEMQESSVIESKGPSMQIAFKNGLPSKAAEGFARGQNVAVEDLVERDGYIYAVKNLQGEACAKLLPAILNELMLSINFPKNMRWGDNDLKFVRPIHWLVVLLDTQILPLSIVDIHSSNFTFGHRFLSKGKIIINNPEEYITKLNENFVIVHQDERRDLIRKQIIELAQKEGGRADIDEELLEEVTYLVEYPTALCGKFSEEFLALPPEALITPMREHQRYFPLFSAEGKLLAKFITVRNGNSHCLENVIHGNERVLRARLSDAEFFFNEDCKTPLESKIEKLKTVVFQDGLGTLHDKVERIEKLAVSLAELAKVPVTADLKRTARLAKADLTTGMVCEFTELQGIMGREYARLSKETELVSEGIFEHYLPRFAGDALPKTVTGIFVGLADKFDNIVATFSRGLIPSGSQDPYALRRQALGIVNILISAGYDLSLTACIAKTYEALNISLDKQAKLSADLHDFFKLRIKNVLTEQGLRYDLIDALLALDNDRPVDLFARATAIKTFAEHEKFVLAVQAFTRIANICKDIPVKTIDEELFVHDSEKLLYKRLQEVESKTKNFWQDKNYLSILEQVADLAEPINDFFANVMVMDKNEAIKENRLALLTAIKYFSNKIINLSKISVL